MGRRVKVKVTPRTVCGQRSDKECIVYQDYKLYQVRDADSAFGKPKGRNEG